MVNWYQPIQLLKTAADVVFSTTLGRHADNRRAQALSPDSRRFLDYAQPTSLGATDSFWIDYVADCGDGGNPTYAVASALSRDSCEGLPRAHVLIFGGDEVYPAASLLEYDHRLVTPYQDAMPIPPTPAPEVLAIPGNHDWYDSLSSFIRVFCSGELFAGWKTTQSRSYFAARLPASWWLFGVDVQLSHDIDLLQLRYFERIASQFEKAAVVILCCPEPFWIREELDRDWEKRITKTNLKKLVDLLGDRLRVTLAGDLHHYRRHTDGKGRHRITCGCGGAFTHPTHDPIPNTLRGGFEHQVSFPDSAVSRRLGLRNLGFVATNWSFGWITSILYLMIAWGLGANMGEKYAGGTTIDEIATFAITEPLRILRSVFHAAILNEVSMGFVVAMVLGFVAFSDRRFKKFQWLAGSAHAVAHLFGAVFVYWFSTRVCITVWKLPPKSILQYLAAGGLIFPSGWLLGSEIMGLYLWVSLRCFGRHVNEAFSSLRIQDWKGFIRMRIRKDGQLNLNFIGIKDVPRKWRHNSNDAGARWVPTDGRGECEIVDSIEVKRD